jgi:hypothetical protein
MGVTVRSLASQSLSVSGTASISYVPAAGKGAIVKSILLINTSATGATSFTATFQTGSKTVKICPGTMVIPQNGMLELTSEISLSYVDSTGDKVTITCTVGSMDCLISGIERDN